jgi:hypothetical protein
MLWRTRPQNVSTGGLYQSYACRGNHSRMISATWRIRRDEPNVAKSVNVEQHVATQAEFRPNNAWGRVANIFPPKICENAERTVCEP